MAKKIFLAPFRFVFAVLWHPVSLIAATILLNVYALKDAPLSTFSFSQTQLPDWEAILFFVALAVYGLGVGYQIAKKTVHFAAIPVLALSILIAIGIGLKLDIPVGQPGSSYFLFINIFLIACISLGTAVMTIVLYLSSHTAWPLVPSGVIGDIRKTGKIVATGYRWIGKHRLVSALIILQLLLNIFFLYRMEHVESRLGSTIFTMCNADESIKAAKQSIVRVESEEGVVSLYKKAGTGIGDCGQIC